MSEIDGYKHKLLGFITCPYEQGMRLPGGDRIPIYKILADSASGDSFVARSGDILVGGGGGEIPVFRISMPQAARFLTDSDWDDFSNVGELYQHYWPPEVAYLLCAGFRQLGWNPSNQGIESWVAEHIVSFVRRYYANEFEGAFGQEELEQDGKICRLPSRSENS